MREDLERAGWNKDEMKTLEKSCRAPRTARRAEGRGSLPADRPQYPPDHPGDGRADADPAEDAGIPLGGQGPVKEGPSLRLRRFPFRFPQFLAVLPQRQ